MQDPVTISGNLSFRAQYRAARAFFARTKYCILVYASFVAVPLLGIVVLARRDEISEPSLCGLPKWLILLLVPFLGFVVIPLIQGLNVWLMRRKNVAIRGVLTFTVSPEGFEVRGESFELKLRWDAVHRVVETRDFFFLYVAAVAAHVIPKGWAGSSSELEAIRTIIRGALHERAKLQTPPETLK